MSLDISAEVWKHSQQSGSELIVMLALADNADTDSRLAWPSIAYLARKSRMTDRGVQKVLRRLEDSGEIEIRQPTTGRKTNTYRINEYPVDQVAPVYEQDEREFTLNDVHPEQPFTPTPNGGSPHPRTAVHPNRNRTVKEPSLPPAPARESDDLANDVVVEWCRLAGVERPHRRIMASLAARQLVDAGLLPGEVESLYRYVVSWAGSADLPLMLKQYDKWRSSVAAKDMPMTKEEADRVLPWNSMERAKYGLMVRIP